MNTTKCRLDKVLLSLTRRERLLYLVKYCRLWRRKFGSVSDQRLKRSLSR